jgi:O-antigen ligase
VGRRLAAAALVVGIGVAALSVSAGWWTRASDEGSDLTNQRSSHVEESFELIGRHPLFGAGPGRYLVALQHEVRQDPGVDLAPVHNFVLLAAAESGILAGAAALAFMGALALRAIRGGWWSVAAYATFVPYLVFDHFPFTTPEGLVMTAMWTGSVLLLAEERSAGSARSPVAVDAQRHAEEVDGPAAHR